MNAFEAVPLLEVGDKYGQMLLFLEEDDGYWLGNDTWDVRDSVFATYGLTIGNRHATKQIHFSTFKDERLKNEAKFFNEEPSSHTVLCVQQPQGSAGLPRLFHERSWKGKKL